MVNVRNKFRNENDRVINFMLDAKESKGWSTMPMNTLLYSSDDQEWTKRNETTIAAIDSSSETDSRENLSLSAENVFNYVTATSNPSEMENKQIRPGPNEKDGISLNIWMPMLYSLFALLIATQLLHLHQSQHLLGTLNSEWLIQYSMAISVAFGVCGIALACLRNPNSPIENCSNLACGQSISLSQLISIALVFTAFLGFCSFRYLVTSCSLTSLEKEGSGIHEYL